MKCAFRETARPGDQKVVQRPVHLPWTTRHIMESGVVAHSLIPIRHPWRRNEFAAECVSQNNRFLGRAVSYFNRVINVRHYRHALRLDQPDSSFSSMAMRNSAIG